MVECKTFMENQQNNVFDTKTTGKEKILLFNHTALDEKTKEIKKPYRCITMTLSYLLNKI